MEIIPRDAGTGENLDVNLITSVSIVGAAAVIAVVLRVISRRTKDVRLGADDYTILAALILALCLVGNTFVSMHYGLGKHIATLAPENFVPFMQTQWASQLLWATSVPIVKTSILLLYLRTFGSIRYIRIAAWVLIAFCIMWGIATVVTTVLQCRPISLIWYPNISGACINERLFFQIVTGINVVTDVVVLALPLHATWRLSLSVQQKFSITGIILLGGFTCGVSIARWVWMFRVATVDPTYDLFFPYIWSCVEPCVGIVSACLPTMRPLVSKSIKGFRRNTKAYSLRPDAHSSHAKNACYIKELALPTDDPEKYQRLVNIPSPRSLADLDAARMQTKSEAEMPWAPEHISPVFARAELSASREIPRSYDVNVAARLQNLI